MKFSVPTKFTLLVSTIFIGTASLGLDRPVQAESGQELEVKISTGATIQSAENQTIGDNFSVSYSENDGVNIKRSFFKVDLSAVPKDMVITSAELNLRISGCTGDTTPIHISRIISDWQVNTVSWKDKPGFSTPTSTANLDCINELGFWDITSLVNSWFDGDHPNLGFVIYGPDDRGSNQYDRIFDIEADNSVLLLKLDKIELSPAKAFQENYLNRDNVILSLTLGAILCLLILLYHQIKCYIRERKAEPKVVNVIKKQEKKLVQSGEYLLKALVQKKKEENNETNKKNITK